uniref:Uncharacterized protein n=1 Tax=Podarcis muralis TaxID=64176 RepID=A0A670I4K2_PODMU
MVVQASGTNKLHINSIGTYINKVLSFFNTFWSTMPNRKASGFLGKAFTFGQVHQRWKNVPSASLHFQHLLSDKWYILANLTGVMYHRYIIFIMFSFKALHAVNFIPPIPHLIF